MRVPTTFKKRKGFLTLEQQTQTLKWIEDGTGALGSQLAIPVSSIEKQLANAVGKGNGKILLKIVLFKREATSSEFSFLFQSERDRDSAIAAIKDQMQKLAAAAASTGDHQNKHTTLSDHEKKVRMALLSSNPEWERLFIDLVVKRKTLSEEDFWSSRQDILTQQQLLTNQKRGTASALLADIKPTDTDGATNEIKFTVNADIIHSTFTLYPGVHKAYLDLVPDKITEKEFWTKWFGSKYFHKSRINQAKTLKEKDIFESYMSQIENDTNPHPENLVFEAKNKLLDLTRTFEDHLETGNRPDSTMRAGKVKDSLPLIRKFNRHSQLILNGTAQKQPSKRQKTTHDFSRLFQKETEIADLESPIQDDYIPLTIRDPTNYFDHQVRQLSPSKKGSLSKSKAGKQPIIDLSQVTLESLLSKSALSLISSKNYSRTMSGVYIPVTLYEECKSLHASGIELLRHYWSSYLILKTSVHDQTHLSKLARISTALAQIRERIDEFVASIDNSTDRDQCDGLLASVRESLGKAC